MPGAYAHLTLINLTHNKADNDAAVPVNVKIATGDHLQFCELGGISPDYPYLDILDSDAASWADLMHYTNTTQMIRSGVLAVAKMSGDKQSKCLAWLLGYAAHVAADVTIHPIVELKVGPYKGNETHHRICEMHQDAYIYNDRLNLGKVGLSEHLDAENNGIQACHRPGNTHRIDAAVFDLWNTMLKECHPGVHKLNPPNIDSWHDKFGPIVDTIEESSALPAFARHVAVDAGLTYPEPDEVDKAEYVDSLKTPEGNMTYGDIFDRAIDNVIALWIKVGHDVAAGKIDQLASLGEWNLDTGRDESNALVYWTE
ncbi:MAG: zinc dependent phospholipase C family protein [Magnetovibrio sp.]|nr:zinc dependent phospholipase C family protein [Magnetovibrio sp.]